MKNQLLQHAVKAIKYRLNRALGHAHDTFGGFTVNDQTRTPAEILNHMCDLSSKACMMIKEDHFNCPLPPQMDIGGEIERLNVGLEQLITDLSNHDLTIEFSERLLQGPILDMATHVGQIAMLNGLYGDKIPKENYFRADIDQ